MEGNAESLAFLRYKLREVEKVTHRQEEEIAAMRREIATITKKLSENCEKGKDKLKLGREKVRKRRESLEKVQKEECEKTRVRTDKRLEELRLEQIRVDEALATQLPE
jgi:hypothetical protein